MSSRASARGPDARLQGSVLLCKRAASSSLTPAALAVRQRPQSVCAAEYAMSMMTRSDAVALSPNTTSTNNSQYTTL